MNGKTNGNGDKPHVNLSELDGMSQVLLESIKNDLLIVLIHMLDDSVTVPIKLLDEYPLNRGLSLDVTNDRKGRPKALKLEIIDA